MNADGNGCVLWTIVLTECEELDKAEDETMNNQYGIFKSEEMYSDYHAQSGLMKNITE